MTNVERLLYEDDQLRITMRATPAAPILTLTGEVDITNSPALANTLTLARRGGSYVVVDTGALTFIDLSGIRVLIMPAVPCDQRWIRLCNITPFQRRLMQLVGWFEETHPHKPEEALG